MGVRTPEQIGYAQSFHLPQSLSRNSLLKARFKINEKHFRTANTIIIQFYVCYRA